eukprot:TRINITY_DN2352_c0_g1_i5.p1 TRINITY_DN2352_c0_g1~~TRINITY_DN2352_c0_g1_i5.p1  ORF type:complete len:295 (-),score=90.22 TRINITY_DN2352_c0_g1_i5:448-1332(-)
MLRSLVGSEMCIRDRYQRRVRGFIAAIMSIKSAMVLLALIALATANVEQEMANERADIEYRVSFKTKSNAPAGKDYTDDELQQNKLYASTGVITVEIVGTQGTTGEQTLIDHPSYIKQEDGSWTFQPGMQQIARFSAANVGEVSEVKLKNSNDDNWSPTWIKVNTNHYQTGEGNGILYAAMTQTITQDAPCEVAVSGCPDDNCLYKCDASFCNSKSEAKFLGEGPDIPPTHSQYDEHGHGHYGPLGEGMPGTHHDHHSMMAHGHFMQEFWAMHQIEDDDEDFLKSHTAFLQFSF